jgi:hypothetical protein
MEEITIISAYGLNKLPELMTRTKGILMRLTNELWIKEENLVILKT